MPAVHRVRPARGLHVLLGPARSGADRVRQGHAHLPRHHRGGHLPADAARRLGRHLRQGGCVVRRVQQGERRRHRGRARRRPRAWSRGMGAAQWAYASLSLGSALALFMYPHSVTAVLSTKSRDIIRRNAALLPAYSFLLGLLALLGTRRDRRRRQGRQRPAGHPAAVRAGVQPVVRGRRVRGHRDRRPGAGGHHVDRRGEPLDAQHLQGVHQARCHRRPGGAAEQARQPGREVRCPRVRAGAAERVRHQPAAARRHLDRADASGDRHRALHALVPPLRAAGRMGRRHDLGHGRGVQHARGRRSRLALRRVRRRRSRSSASTSPTTSSTSASPRWCSTCWCRPS